MRRSITLSLSLLLMLAAVFVIARAQDDTPAQGEEPTAENLPITEDVRYAVGLGDTLDDIAATFDVSVDCLAEINDLVTPGQIVPGQVLLVSVDCPPYIGLNYVPFPREAPAADSLGQGGGGGALYVVRLGDTLDEIAFAYDVSLIALIEYNDIARPAELQPGTVLEIPPDAPAYGRVPPPPGVNIAPGQGGGGIAEFDEEGITYTIQPRDTLDTIGAFYNANPACIAETNGITQPQLIQPRTVIFIPAACAPYVGPNTTGGVILPADGEPTVVPTFDPLTPQPTELVVPTITPTPEVLDDTTEIPFTPAFTDVPPTDAPTKEAPNDVTEAAPTEEATDDVTDEAPTDVPGGGVASPTPTNTLAPTLDADIVPTPTSESLFDNLGDIFGDGVEDVPPPDDSDDLGGGGGPGGGNLIDTLRELNIEQP